MCNKRSIKVVQNIDNNHNYQYISMSHRQSDSTERDSQRGSHQQKKGIKKDSKMKDK